MERFFTTGQACQQGLTPSGLKWSCQQQAIHRVRRGIYVEGVQPTWTEKALAIVHGLDGVAAGFLAGCLFEFDSIRLDEPFVILPPNRNSTRINVMRRELSADETCLIDGLTCTTAKETLIDLARFVDDNTWEQALESALRKKLIDIESLLEVTNRRGMKRVRRVIDRRGIEVPATESLLETLAVQLLRENRRVPEPKRQVVVESLTGDFVARVDLAWPELGVFLELDGEHHKGQPVYDARRETAIVATKGWLPGRFTWTEITKHRQASLRRVEAILDMSAQIRGRSA